MFEKVLMPNEYLHCKVSNKHWRHGDGYESGGRNNFRNKTYKVLSVCVVFETTRLNMAMKKRTEKKKKNSL